MTDLWAACEQDLPIAPLTGELLRIVESQEQIATLSLVDDLAEQALLEDLLEQTQAAPAGGRRKTALPALDPVPLPAAAPRLPLRPTLRAEPVLRHHGSTRIRQHRDRRRPGR
jgi:hypothetical protein